jgi:hypothetical protein
MTDPLKNSPAPANVLAEVQAQQDEYIRLYERELRKAFASKPPTEPKEATE